LIIITLGNAPVSESHPSFLGKANAGVQQLYTEEYSPHNGILNGPCATQQSVIAAFHYSAMTSIGDGTRDEARSVEDSPSTRSFKRMKLSPTDREVPAETLTIVGRDVQKIEIFYDLFGIIQRSFPGRFRHMKNSK